MGEKKPAPFLAGDTQMSQNEILHTLNRTKEFCSWREAGSYSISSLCSHQPANSPTSKSDHQLICFHLSTFLFQHFLFCLLFSKQNFFCHEVGQSVVLWWFTAAEGLRKFCRSWAKVPVHLCITGFLVIQLIFCSHYVHSKKNA